MNQQGLINALTDNVPTFASQIADALIAAQIDSYTPFSREQLMGMATRAVQAFLRDLSDGGSEQFAGYWNQVAEARAQQGARIEDLAEAVYLSDKILDRFVTERFADNLELRVWWLGRLHTIVSDGVSALLQIFSAVREEIIRAQASQIRELSTPIIPLHTGVMALPLVGTIDSARAGQILETLLTGISEQQADVVIIDITGVPVVDTAVANYLLQAAQAARLLGAQVVLVGISAEVAQTIVQVGADLSTITTRATLQDGITYAFGLLNIGIEGKSA